VPFSIENKLVVAIASSALFDLQESHRIFQAKGAEEYRKYQRDHEDDILQPGVAFHFVRRLLGFNPPEPEKQQVEVILLSRNDSDTGQRVMNSIEKHGLAITRGAFLRGDPPYEYLGAFNVRLFLSGNREDVKEAVDMGHPAGQVVGSAHADDPKDLELRIAFDFDGVLADDEAERVFQAKGLKEFHASEQEKAANPLGAGPLKSFLEEVSRLQQIERERSERDPGYRPRLKTAIVTSRNAPAHKRLITTLRSWGIVVDKTFFLGGMDKNRIIEVFRPHLFFEDQMDYAEPAATRAPSVHVPFGEINRRAAKEE